MRELAMAQLENTKFIQQCLASEADSHSAAQFTVFYKT
jgi:hypothetical protein